MSKNPVLISPFKPDAGFEVDNAMARNKYVYCLADAAVVDHSGTMGGTWNVVLEDLRHNWVRIWVKPTEDPESGNAALGARSARWLPEELSATVIGRLWRHARDTHAKIGCRKWGRVRAGDDYRKRGMEGLRKNELLRGFPATLRRMETLTAGEPKSAQELRGELDVCKSQLSAWLKRATQEGRIKKRKRQCATHGTTRL